MAVLAVGVGCLECSVNSWEVWFHRLLALSECWGLRTGGLGETQASKRHQQVEGRQQGGGRPIEKDGKPSQVWTQSRRWQQKRIRTEERRTGRAPDLYLSPLMEWTLRDGQVMWETCAETVIAVGLQGFSMWKQLLVESLFTASFCFRSLVCLLKHISEWKCHF